MVGTILFLLIGMMITMMHDTTRYYKIKTQIVKKKNCLYKVFIVTPQCYFCLLQANVVIRMSLYPVFSGKMQQFLFKKLNRAHL